MRGSVAARKAESRRTLGRWLEPKRGRVTFVPRPGASRPARAAWGPPQPAWPLGGETPGRTKDEAPRRWHGDRAPRQGEGEESDGRVAWEALRFVVVPASHRAPQQPQTSASGPGKAAEAVAAHVNRGPAQWLAGLPDAHAALAASAGHRPGQRGRRPRPWR